MSLTHTTTNLLANAFENDGPLVVAAIVPIEFKIKYKPVIEHVEDRKSTRLNSSHRL